MKTSSTRTPVERQILDTLFKCLDAKDIHDSLGIITNEACKIAGGKGGSIWLRSAANHNKIVLNWSYRHEQGHASEGNVIGEAFYTNELDAKGFYDGLTGWVFAEGAPLLIKDIENKKEIAQYPRLRWKDKFKGFSNSRQQERQRSFMAVPIFSSRTKNSVIGVLRVSSTRNGKKHFSQGDLKILQLFSGHISGVLTNYLKRQEEERLLTSLFTTPNACDIQPVLEELANSVPVVLDGSFCSIFLRNGSGKICLEASNSPKLRPMTRRVAGENNCLQYKDGEGKTGSVAQSGVHVECANSKSVKPASEIVGGSAFLAVPIAQIDGVVLGVIRVVRPIKTGMAFDEPDRIFLERLAQRLLSILSFCGLVGRGNCFVIMPFSDKIQSIYNGVIKPTIERLGFSCRTEADYQGPTQLMPSIMSHIANASFIVAEVTDRNANVFYELGIAHALSKNVILLTQKDVPSDIRSWRYLLYRNRIGDGEVLEKNLELAVRQGIADGHIVSRY